MSLTPPDLDDRRFQELVNEAKIMVQQRCPEWTDHNVSDPGVTLIELFAWMTDQLLYRLNQVPDRNFITFLDLLGVERFPPTMAHADLTFWLAGETQDTITVPAGTEVATESPTDEPTDDVVFQTSEDLAMPPRRLALLMVERDGDRFDETELLKGGAPFACFAEEPAVGDALLLGLDEACASLAIQFDLECTVEGVGVDPDDPPLLWEAWDGDDWVPCEVDTDSTGGLNQQGSVIVHVDAGHRTSIIDKERAGWLRCRVVEAEPGQPVYTASPRIHAASAWTAGGTVEAVHRQVVVDEIVGLAEGVPGERFTLEYGPVLAPDEPMEIQVAAEGGWEPWTQVDRFDDAGPTDHVFVLDAASQELQFGPAVRARDGSLRHHGAVLPPGGAVRVPHYSVGGGARGNVLPGQLVELRSAIASVDSVTNRRAAVGGVDVESMESVRRRGPTTLRTRDRAVTVEDFEHLARAAAPEVARVRCVPVTEGEDAGTARILVVPTVADTGGQLPFEDLIPTDATLARIADHLDQRRTIGARVVVEPPTYQGVTIVARLKAEPRANADRLAERALAALHSYFHPTTGGPDGQGWPFGRSVHIGEVYSVLQRQSGTEFVEEALLFAADPVSGDRGSAAERIDIDDNSLLFSYEHRIRVEQ
jgi:predicted phage baseplate assembly protein